jgi:hypothetical protein
VGVGNHSDDISVRNYDKFKRVRIYDTAANKNNWQFSCGWNSLHVYVRLTNIVTNKSINFYHFDRNDEVTGANLGNCGVLIKSINPNYYQSNVGQDYLTCSLNDVLNNTNNCVQDGQGTNGFFEVEFVDTSTSSETLESFVGR